MPQIARIWFGKLPSSKREEYIEYVKQTGVKELRATPGNQGVLVITLQNKEIAEIGVISFWESRLATEGFAGKDIDQAVYYPEDSRYLFEMEPRLRNFDISVVTGLSLTDKES